MKYGGMKSLRKRKFKIQQKRALYYMNIRHGVDKNNICTDESTSEIQEN